MAHVESYRLRDGSKRYRARWVAADGRERSRSFVLKKDADRFVLEQQRRVSLAALYQAPPQTLGEFVAGWLDRYALRVRPSTLAHAKERGHVVDEGVFRVKAPRRDQPEMRFLDWDEVEELAANTIAPYGNLVQLAALTGLRQGELFALRDRNTDLEAMTIQVEHGAYRGELVPVKTRASRRRVDLSST